MNELKQEIHDIAVARGQEARDSIKHLATEVIELQDAVTIACMKLDGTSLRDVKYEIADVIINTISIARHLEIALDVEIDIDKSVREKIDRNKRRL